MTGGPTTRVLIIDSDNVRRGMLACTLPPDRYSLEFASIAGKGLDVLLRIEPDVVILEAGDLCQRIRSLPTARSCTLILIDERFHDEATGRSEAEAAGADSFLPFPFEMDLFERRLGHIDHRPRATGEGSPPTDAAEACPRQPTGPTPPLEQSWRRFEEQVDLVHRHLEVSDYYELLKVDVNAGALKIKQAYFDRSIEYHPDRFMRLDDQDLREKIYQIFKRMSEAFKVLVNPEARRNYDVSLSGPSRQTRYVDRGQSGADDPLKDAHTPAGKKHLNYAILAESNGNIRSARMYLSMALQYEPDNEALHLRLDDVTSRLR